MPKPHLQFRFGQWLCRWPATDGNSVYGVGRTAKEAHMRAFVLKQAAELATRQPDPRRRAGGMF